MKKHAYLIMAHNEFHMLKKLLQEIDDERNDIYLHIDKKTKGVNKKEISSWITKSKLFFVKRKRVYWGTLSIVKCEFSMLSNAVYGNYHYYHLVSGVDFPLKSQDYIHEFLSDKANEYIEFFKEGERGNYFMQKLKYYYPLLRFVGRGNHVGLGIKNRILRKLETIQQDLTDFQEQKGVDRTKKYKNIVFYKGNQWFSITHDFAIYILSQKRELLKMFWLTNGADEFILPTLAMNSRFSSRAINQSLREIDWVRGRPYEFKLSDLEELKNSDAFFVRKVSYDDEPKLVNELIKYIHTKN